MNHRMSKIVTLLLSAVVLGLTATPAQAASDPCGLSKRLRYRSDVGNESLNDVFASAQSIEQRNAEVKGSIRAGKCELIKLAKASKWKEAMGALRKAAAANPDVAHAAKKFLDSLPSDGTLNKLSSDAKALDQKFKSMAGVQVSEEFSEHYTKNSKLLPKTIAASVSYPVRVTTLRTKLNKLIAKHGG